MSQTEPLPNYSRLAPIKLAVFISGRGSNFQAIYEAIQRGDLMATIAVVVSNNPNASGVQFAHANGLSVIIKVPGEFSTMDAYEAGILNELNAYSVDLVVLAGYMRLIGPRLLAAFPNRIINIHPSLLPKYKGLHAQAQAIADGATESGCTVHYVDATLDGGPIIAQSPPVPVFPNDSVEQLSNRILEQEHRLYPAVIQKLANPLNSPNKKELK